MKNRLQDGSDSDGGMSIEEAAADRIELAKMEGDKVGTMG